jgi:hypothetical protein
MMNEELSEQEIRQLEQQLRSYGDPYASPEPDERYFANFRVRVMERISERPESVGFMQRVSEFLFGSSLRMAVTGGSLIAGALVYFSLQSSPESPQVVQEVQQPNEIVVPSPQSIEPNTVTAPAPEKQVARPSTTTIARKEQQSEPVIPAAPQNKVSETTPSGNIADASAQFEQIDELSMSDESEPVSYDRLSMDELEAVLKTLETEPLTIQ